MANDAALILGVINLFVMVGLKVYEVRAKKSAASPLVNVSNSPGATVRIDGPKKPTP
jgi:hypothetical protein